MSHLPTPPVVSGHKPGLGHYLEFEKSRNELLMRGYKEKGSIYALKLAHKKMAILIGPEYATQFFEETGKKLHTEKAFSFLKPMIGEVGIATTHERYLQQRPVIYEPFKRRKMATYVKVMQEQVQKWLDKLGEEGEMEIVDEMRQLTQDVVGNAMMGEKFQNDVGDEFWENYDAIGKAIDPILPPNLPIPKFRNRDKARAKMLKILKPILQERRENGDKYNDFMQEFVNTKDHNGNPYDDETILNFIVTLMLGGHETTSGQSAWAIIELLRNPDYREIMLQEINDKLPYRTDITEDKLKSLEHVTWAMEETTRIHPSGSMTLRSVEEDWEVGGHLIPKGWLAAVVATVSHKLPELYENPESWNPLRFSKEAMNGCPEGKDHHHSNIGFGGGVHRCAGMFFAMNEMNVICALLFQQFNLELITKDTKILYGQGTDRPTKTIVRYKRKPQHELDAQREKVSSADGSGCPYHSTEGTIN